MKKQGYTEMTMGLLEKSPEAGRLLVKLHDKHTLHDLAKNKQPGSRAELANIMTDLLQFDLTTGEHELITDVLMGLIRQAEIDLRRALSEKLAVMEEAPLRMVLHLANDDISVADPILRRSRVLTDTDLTYIVKGRGKEHWCAIATRPEMSRQLINLLVDTEDLETAIHLSENKNVRLTSHALRKMSTMAEISDRLAKPLLMREEMPPRLATKLYGFVGRELKDYIKDNYKMVDQGLVEQAVDDIVFEMSSAAQGEYAPTVKMIVSAENMLEKGFLNAEVMVENLRRGQIANFVALFSVYSSLSIDTVLEMLHQKTGQGLAVACKATGIQKPEFVNMFLLTSRVRGGKVIEQQTLGRALAYYDKIKEPLAKKILSQSRN